MTKGRDIKKEDKKKKKPKKKQLPTSPYDPRYIKSTPPLDRPGFIKK